MDTSKLLYSVYNYSEWTIQSQEQQEPSFRIPQSFNVSVWSILRNTGSSIRSNVSNVVFPLNSHFLLHKQHQLDWKLALNSDGTHLAILKEDEVSLLTSEDNFAECVYNEVIVKDYSQKWASLVWSPNGDYLVHISSKVLLTVYDRALNQLSSLTIGGAANFETSDVLQANQLGSLNFLATVDCAKCICSVDFAEREDALDIFCLSYKGSFHCYHLHRSSSDIQKGFTVNMAPFYSKGVYCMVYSNIHNVFLTGTTHSTIKSSLFRESEKKGVILWRYASQSPWLVNFEGESCEQSLKSMKSSNWNAFPKVFSRKPLDVADGVSKLVLNSSHEFVFSMNWFGSVVQWSMPSLNLVRIMELDQLCQETPEASQHFNIFKSPGRVVVPSELSVTLCDMQMWEDDQVIFSKFAGRLDIQRIESLESVLPKCEEFSSPVQLLHPYEVENGHRAFVGLEMEKREVKLKRQFHISESSDQNDEDSSDDEQYQTVMKRSKHVMKHALYFLTESDRFQPPRKKPKMISRIYRVFSFRSTTPEVLFKIKLGNEEFGEALSLAERFHLDSDLVYMKQWRKYPVSTASIHDYLRKVSKRHWILRECQSRISSDIDATRALLNYGLQGTEIEVLLDNSDESLSTYTPIADHSDFDCAEDLALLSRQELDEKRQESRKTKLSELLEDFKSIEKLRHDQIVILKTRRKLAHYLRVLIMYEEVLGGSEAASQNFSSQEFLQIRDKTFLEIATEFARSCDWRAVDTFLTHLEELEPHRLYILSNFPETLSASDYKDLLPQSNFRDSVPPLFVKSLFDQDWSSDSNLEKLLPVKEAAALPQHSDLLSLVPPDILKPASLTIKSSVEWYFWRARYMEKVTGIICGARELLEIGSQRGIPGLSQVLNDMQFLESVVYESQCDILLKFEKFEQLSEFEKLWIVVEKSSSEFICQDMRKFIKPRLNTLSAKRQEQLLRQLLLSMSQKGLTKLVKIYEACKHPDPPIETNQYSLLTNAVDCIYNCPRSDQLPQAYAIINCLPLRSSTGYDPKNEPAFAAVDLLEVHLETASILEKFCLRKPFVYFKQVQDNPNECENLIGELISAAVKGQGGRLSTVEDWADFLVHNMIPIQRKLATLVTGPACIRILVQNLLRSEHSGWRKIATRFLNFSSSSESIPFSYASVANYKLSFGETCEMVLSVATELVDSSPSLADNTIGAALSLLKLAEVPTKDIQLEIDFIELITVLQSYKCDLLPVQIRHNYNTDKLLRHILGENPGAYRGYKRLMTIASLFHHDGTTTLQRDCIIWCAIAEFALKDKYVDLALNMCHHLIGKNYASAWRYCWQLAATEELKNEKSKHELLLFAMTHCHEDILPEIVQFKSGLSCSTHCVSKAGKDDEKSRRILFPVLESLESTGKNLLLETQSTTKTLLNLDSKSVEKKQVYLSGHCFYGTSASQKSQGSLSLDVNPIYAALRQKCHQVLKNGVEGSSLNQEFLNCAEHSMPHNAFYSLCLALTGNSDSSFQDIADRGWNERNLSYSLLGLSLLHSVKTAVVAIGDLFSKSPKEIILLSNCDAIDIAHCRLTDFVHQSKLVNLESGIDASRFSTEAKYRLDTVLGLAASTESTHLHLALELARHHNIDEWGVYMCHFSHLLCDCPQLNLEEISSSIEKENLAVYLSANKRKFLSSLLEDVYPLLDLTDLQKLEYLFDLVNGLDEGKLIFGLSAKEHVQILSALKQLSPDFPYKSLFETESVHRILHTIASVCNEDNFETLTKELSKIPIGDSGRLDRSGMVLAVAQREFYKMDVDPEKALRTIRSCIDCLNIEHLQTYSELVAYQGGTIEVTDVESIRVIVRKCLASSRKLKSKKKGPEPPQVIAIQSILEHVELIKNSAVIMEWLKGEEREKIECAKRIWGAKNQEGALERECIGLLLKGGTLENAHMVLQSMRAELSLTDIVTRALDSCIISVNFEKSVDTELQPAVDLLLKVKTHLAGWGELVNEENVVSKLRQIIQEPAINPGVKVFMLEKSEKLFSFSDEDLKSLLLSRTKELLGGAFPVHAFAEDDLASEQSRFELTCDLIGCSVTARQLEVMYKLLHVWPRFQDLTTMEQHPLYGIFCKWVQIDLEDATIKLPPLFCECAKEEYYHEILSLATDFCVEQNLNELALVLALSAPLESNVETLVQVLDCEQPPILSSDLFPQLVHSGVLPRLVDTSCYSAVSEYIIQEQNSELMAALCNQLNSFHLDLEAAELLSAFSDFHPTFTTISGTVHYFKSWLLLSRR